MLPDGHEGARSDGLELSVFCFDPVFFGLFVAAGRELFNLERFLFLLSLLIDLYFDVFCSNVVEMCEKVVELIRVNKRLAVTFNTQLILARIKKVAKIDMEEATRILLEHKVRGVSISDPQNIGGHTLPCQRSHEAMLISP